MTNQPTPQVKPRGKLYIDKDQMLAAFVVRREILDEAIRTHLNLDPTEFEYNPEATEEVNEANSVRRRNVIDQLQSCGKLPKIDDTIGAYILKISQKLVTHRYFSGFQNILGDLDSTAIETSIRYLDRYDVKINPNAFAHFTSVSWRAISNRCKLERARYHKSIQHRDSTLAELDFHDSHESQLAFNESTLWQEITSEES